MGENLEHVFNYVFLVFDYVLLVLSKPGARRPKPGTRGAHLGNGKRVFDYLF